MRHPAEYWIKSIIILHPDWDDAMVAKKIEDWGHLSPHDHYVEWIRYELANLQKPDGFDPLNLNHRPSMRFLREQGVYEVIRNAPEMQEAWDIISNPDQRLLVEQVILSRLDFKMAAQKINKQMGWFLSADGIKMFRHYFWNTKLLTFDQWGRFLYGRNCMYERHMALLQGNPRLALFHLRIEQAVESKQMIQRSQEIAYFTLEEVNMKPGTDPAKVKAISVLTKSVVECHEALSTSDMALKDVLKQFERFRMEHPTAPPLDLRQLAPLGNFSGGGADQKDKKNGLQN